MNILLSALKSRVVASNLKRKACIKSLCEVRKPTPINMQVKFQAMSDCAHISEKNRHWSSFVRDVNSYIKPDNFLGSGAEARVYKLNENYVLRLSGGTISVDKKFLPVQDVFEGRNYGQAVAISDDGLVSINRFVKGDAIYKCGEREPNAYLEKLRKYSNFSDETLEKFIEDVSFINKKGYRIDESNPENFLYDAITKRIGIVDISKQGSSSLDLCNPYGHDWILSVLCHSRFLSIASKMSTDQKKR